MSTLIWFDGAVVEDRPLLSALDRGLTVGHGVFETCAVVGGVAFALSRHLDRLQRSAAALGLPHPPVDVVRDAVAELLAVADGGPGRLRVTWTAGSGAPGAARSEDAPTLVVTFTPEPGLVPAPSVDSVSATSAVSLVVVPWVRNERSPLTGVKSTSYAENVLALDYARGHGGTEAVLGNTRGELCEGAATNVFIEQDGRLLTPPLSAGCLAGVTRELVLEWGREAGVPVHETPIPLAALATVDHVAVTSSLRGIVPVTSVDGRALRAGLLTEQMMEVFAARFAEDTDP